MVVRKLWKWGQSVPKVEVMRKKRLLIDRGTFVCLGCGKETERRRSRGNGLYNTLTKYCSIGCRDKFNCGANHASWQGGRWTDADGYVHLSVGNGKHKPEHVAKAEKVLGRSLRKNEMVHHVDGDKGNNANSNLIICDKSYHQWLHMRMSYLYQIEHFRMAA
jgi:HNH endonuclease